MALIIAGLAPQRVEPICTGDDSDPTVLLGVSVKRLRNYKPEGQAMCHDNETPA